MISYLIIALFFGLIGAIYWGFWYGTRTKLKDEKVKNDFLENKFSYLKNIEFNSKLKSIIRNGEDLKTIRSEFDDILKKFVDNGFKKGKVTEITASLPYNDKKPWIVYSTLKSGTWPFNDKEENIKIFSIIDIELENLEEYKKYKSKS
tara:strand:+ start:47 stop:490 length:444 start_codon:yes stop_codon:yes gene_type:complete